jgi:hypothetical protein
VTASSRSGSSNAGGANTSARSPSSNSRGAKKAASSSSKSASAKKSSARSGGSSATTTDHDEIRNWVEARGGFPARVASTGRKNDPGILRIDYPGFSGTGTLERIDWDEWFEWFDRDKLAFLYQDKTNSRFSKLISR